MKVIRQGVIVTAVIVGLFGIMGSGGGSDDSGETQPTPQQIPITTSLSVGGTISPSSANITANTTTSFTITVDEGYTLGSISGCNGTLSNNVYTTGQVAASCNISVDFTYINKPPTVNVGNDIGVEVLSAVTLSPTASDPEDNDLTFNWSQLSGPAVELNTQDNGTLTFMAPDVAAAQTLIFEVTVDDNNGGNASDSVNVYVAPQIQVTGTLNKPKINVVGSVAKGEVTFTWQPSASTTEMMDGVDYSVHTSTIENFEPSPSSIVQTSLVSSTSTITGLEGGEAYYLRIVAEAGDEKAISEVYPVLVSNVEIKLVDDINVVKIEDIATELVPNADGQIIADSADNLAVGDVILNGETGALVQIKSIDASNNAVELEDVNVGAVFQNIRIESRVKSN